MRIKQLLALTFAAAMAVSVQAAPMGTAFIYQGSLQDGGVSPTGLYDFKFKLYDAATVGTLLNPPDGLNLSAVGVTNGLFSVKLDFGASVFQGEARWLNIHVKTNSNLATFSELAPRQELTPQPYAITAENLHGSVPAAQLTGTLPAGSLSGAYVNALTLNNAGNSISGNGAGLTGLNASQLTSGTVADARLGANVALLNANQTFTGLNSFSGNISFLDPTKSITFPTSLGTSTPMMYMFATTPFPLGNADRMVMARSPSYPDWGLQYQDVANKFHFLNGGTSVMTIDLSSRKVGIGTTTPTDRLTVEGNIRVNDHAILLRAGSDINHGLAWSNSVAGISVDGPVLWGYDGGALGAVLNTPVDVVALKWDYGGNVWISNNCSVATLTIRGGADLAEPFNITSENNEVPQGAVVVIDERNPGHLKLSDRPYDTRVAGVVSGANGINPGIQMQQQGLLDGGKNVALTGRVYVQADASNGAVAPGDLLTTSRTPGHAMKVTDHARAQGAILGKAMTGLNEGKGMVLVLVTLQ